MNDRNINNLIESLKDAEKELPSDLNEKLHKEDLESILKDRTLDAKLSQRLPLSVSPRMTAEEFKQDLRRRIENSEKVQKPSGDALRNTLIFLREKLLYSEIAAFQLSGAAAVLLIAVSLPMILSENIIFSVNYEEGLLPGEPSSQELSIKQLESRSPAVSSGISEGNNFRASAPTTAAAEETDTAESPRFRERSFAIVIEDSETASDEETIEKKDKDETLARKMKKSSHEETLLEALSSAETDEKRLVYLKKLEELYVSTNEKDKLADIRRKIQSLE